jgi:phosphoribosylanthranilate isomerase
MTTRTRIKICGLRTVEHVRVAAEAGADAIGLVFYAKSPRHVDVATAAELARALPPYVSLVGLFVNAGPDEVAAVVKHVPLSMLQFHGDETPGQCAEAAAAVGRPFARALRVTPDMTAADLLKYEQEYRDASPLFAGLLLDAFVDGYGGGGKVFDWSLIPEELAPRVVLSGGLNAQNAIDAVARVRPFAVDVSSGVEASKGVKDAARIRAFIEAVRQADRLQEGRQTAEAGKLPAHLPQS